MARLRHGETITIQQFQEARESVAESIMGVPLAFAASQPVDLKDFDFLFPKLQANLNNLLPESSKTVADLARLGKTMIDSTGNDKEGDSEISAIFTYFGQFLDHDITLEMTSADLKTLTDPALVPLPLDDIRQKLKNARTATLDLDSVYDLPAPRMGNKMQIGPVSVVRNNTQIPFKRPPNKGDLNDLPRDPRSDDEKTDRAARIGDPRNDENTIVAQLHLAFLLAHNQLVDRNLSFTEARRTLRQHYQHIVINDFLPSVADKKIVKAVLKENKFFDGLAEPFFMPLEFAVAAYRFGHTMVRLDYDFNLNFNTSNQPNTVPATVDLLFVFTALSGQLGDFDTLPENWIIQWENFFGDKIRNRARRFDTQLANPLFKLKKLSGVLEEGLGAMLAVRNLLRGYLLRMPTGQAVAKAIGLTPLTPAQLEAVASKVVAPAGAESQLDVLRDSGFSGRTPLWYYILAEAAHHGKGKRLGPVGSTIVAEALIGLIRRSEDSILRTKNWKPTLPSKKKNQFTIEDLLRFAKVL